MDIDNKSDEAAKLAQKIIDVEVAKRDSKELYKAAERVAMRSAEIIGDSLKDKMVKAKQETDLERELADSDAKPDSDKADSKDADDKPDDKDKADDDAR